MPDGSYVLREVMLATSTSQSELSRLSGVWQPSISQFLSGTARLSDEQLDRLLSCMGYRLEVTRRAAQPDLTHSEWRSWRLHRRLSTHLTRPGYEQWRPVMERNLGRLRSAVQGQPHMRNLDRWESLLARDDIPGLHRALTGLDRDSIEMRELSPFSGLLPDGERLEVLQALAREREAQQADLLERLRLGNRVAPAPRADGAPAPPCPAAGLAPAPVARPAREELLRPHVGEPGGGELLVPQLGQRLRPGRAGVVDMDEAPGPSLAHEPGVAVREPGAVRREGHARHVGSCGTMGTTAAGRAVARRRRGTWVDTHTVDMLADELAPLYDGSTWGDSWRNIVAFTDAQVINTQDRNRVLLAVLERVQAPEG
jgi:transcriptional regulator with XRE-family HTH domain